MSVTKFAPSSCQSLPRTKMKRSAKHAMWSRTDSLRIVPFGTVLDFRTTTSQNCEAVSRRARIQGAETFVSLNSSFESDEEEKKKGPPVPRAAPPGKLTRRTLHGLSAPAPTPPGQGFRVWGLRCEVEDLGFRVWDLGFRVWGLVLRV
jgi:hypothetical protein